MNDEESCIAMYLRMNRGDFSAFDTSAPHDTNSEWRVLFRALAANQSDLSPPPRFEPRTPPGWLAIRQLVLRAALAFDLDALRAFAATKSPGPEAAAVRFLAALWLSFWERGAPPEEVSMDPLAKHDPGVRVERASLQALQSLAESDHDEALARARRASRMAASEGLIQMEYLANVVLARVRRHTGSSHLALRILVALEAVVPPLWRPWVGVEKTLAGAALSLSAPLPPVLDREVRTLAAMMGSGTVSPDAEGWISGASEAAPFGIAGPSSDPFFVALMCSSPGQAPRRVLCSGVDPSVPQIATAPRATRTRLALCQLIGAPDGLESAELFSIVYGFPREDAGHDELLRGLIFRVRKALGDHGELVRENERIRLVCKSPFAAPDPRCDRSMEDRMLRFLSASGGRATAKEIASGLGVPLRTVQRGLGTLVEGGACAAQADGRRTEYVLEDTTFAEPTLHRLRGQS